MIGASVPGKGEAGGPHPHAVSRSRNGAGLPGPHLAPSAADPVSHQLKIAKVRAWGTPPSLICHLPNASHCALASVRHPSLNYHLPAPCIPPSHPSKPIPNHAPYPSCALFGPLQPTIPPSTLSQPPSQHPVHFPTTSSPVPVPSNTRHPTSVLPFSEPNTPPDPHFLAFNALPYPFVFPNTQHSPHPGPVPQTHQPHPLTACTSITSPC